MEEKIEKIAPQALEGKGEAKPEELEKIRSMLQEKTSIFIVKDLFPETWNKEYDFVEAKYGDVDAHFENWLDGNEVPEDVKETFGRLYAFIISKSPEEIFESARNLYEAAIKSKSFERAYNLASKYFDKLIQDEAVQTAFNLQYELMSKSKDRAEDAEYAEVFFQSKFGELCLEKATSEQRGDIFEYVIHGRWAQARGNGRALFQTLLGFLDNGTAEIKDRRSVRDFFHEFARETIKNYLKVKRADPHAVEDANFFEKHGLLSLEEDADLFEELTKTT